MPQTAVLTDLQEAVHRGTAILDQHWPGWPLRINQAKLDLRDTTLCVLAQAADAHFGEALETLQALEALAAGTAEEWGVAEDSDLAVHLGFDAPYAYPEKLEALRDVWLDLIRERTAIPGVM